MQLTGRRAPGTATVRHAEHQVRIGHAGISHYLQEMERVLADEPVIINSHELEMPGQQNMFKVRAIWSGHDLTWQWVCRDIMLNQWCHDVMPYIDSGVNTWLSDSTQSTRSRLLRFLRHQFDHGRWQANEVLPAGWTGFCLDRFFCLDFVDDVLALAEVLCLDVDRDLAERSHAQWLVQNRPRDFTPRNAVRYLEAKKVLDLL